MSGIKIEVHSDTTILDAIKEKLLLRGQQELVEIAFYIADDMRLSWSGFYPPASQPGRPPAERTGELDQSIVVGYDTKIRPGKVSIYIACLAEYGADLEYGTIKMAARPFFRPALRRGHRLFKNAFKSIFVE